jgi:hypothetical protein
VRYENSSMIEIKKKKIFLYLHQQRLFETLNFTFCMDIFISFYEIFSSDALKNVRLSKIRILYYNNVLYNIYSIQISNWDVYYMQQNTIVLQCMVKLHVIDAIVMFDLTNSKLIRCIFLLILQKCHHVYIYSNTLCFCFYHSIRYDLTGKK